MKENMQKSDEKIHCATGTTRFLVTSATSSFGSAAEIRHVGIRHLRQDQEEQLVAIPA